MFQMFNMFPSISVILGVGDMVPLHGGGWCPEQAGLKDQKSAFVFLGCKRISTFGMSVDWVHIYRYITTLVLVGISDRRLSRTPPWTCMDPCRKGYKNRTAMAMACLVLLRKAKCQLLVQHLPDLKLETFCRSRSWRPSAFSFAQEGLKSQLLDVQFGPRLCHFVSSLPCSKKATSHQGAMHKIIDAESAMDLSGDLELHHRGEVCRRRSKIWRKRLRVPLTMCGRMWENSPDLGIITWTLCVYPACV